MLARTHVWDKENISRFQEEVLWSGVLSAARAASDGPSGKLQTFPPSNACQREWQLLTTASLDQFCPGAPSQHLGNLAVWRGSDWEPFFRLFASWCRWRGPHLHQLPALQAVSAARSCRHRDFCVWSENTAEAAAASWSGSGGGQARCFWGWESFQADFGMGQLWQLCGRPWEGLLGLLGRGSATVTVAALFGGTSQARTV